nr:immunoglobulin light chain junction region [Macaca mulatta]MOY05000.1 immunoglobulin light chain junction region [Macaca mulatta]MOY06082.1 immunoglobulin light chain junction region [Macaca mulatta]MOY06409.1 immunoglobulin light chain junction region [Macaca mulatta]MOY06866.1 immunoglobulin light chain junction region [Macaca mulatta]
DYYCQSFDGGSSVLF